jgi:hypothetical protein
MGINTKSKNETAINAHNFSNHGSCIFARVLSKFHSIFKHSVSNLQQEIQELCFYMYCI